MRFSLDRKTIEALDWNYPTLPCLNAELLRLTQIDYERNLAFIALEGQGSDLAGIARLYADPDHETAEYRLLVRTDLQVASMDLNADSADG